MIPELGQVQKDLLLYGYYVSPGKGIDIFINTPCFKCAERAPWIYSLHLTARLCTGQYRLMKTVGSFELGRYDYPNQRVQRLSLERLFHQDFSDAS
jgi:hypothetical protein